MNGEVRTESGDPGAAESSTSQPEHVGAETGDRPVHDGESQNAGTGTYPSEQEEKEDSKKGFAAQVIGNTSLLTAVLIYMGWAYENAVLSYFSVPSSGLSISTVEYVLKGMVPLFQSVIIFIGVLLTAMIVIAARVLQLVPEPVGKAVKHALGSDRILILGLLVTAITLPLAWLSVSGGSFDSWFFHHQDVLYFVLALLATGQLLAAWPVRRSGPGPFVYPLALVVAAMCTLWAAGLYARNLGTGFAENIANNLRGQTAATVYSVRSLDLSGPGVTCKQIQPESGYPFQCTGLRLLYADSGTYYLLPVGWKKQRGQTYILDDSNQIRIELSAGQ